MSKKNSYLTLITIAVNLLTYFSLVPYVQTTANSHMNSGAFFGTSYFLISGLLLVFALNRLLKQKDYKVREFAGGVLGCLFVLMVVVQ